MARKYTKIEELTDVIRARKAAGETNRSIGESYALSLKQVFKYFPHIVSTSVGLATAPPQFR